METKIINVNGVQALIRLNTTDEFIVNEIIKMNTYRKLNIYANDVVLDAGLHIGMFTIKALQNFAIVYSFEACKENFIMAKYNIEVLNNNICSPGNYRLYNLAVTGDNRSVRDFSLNDLSKYRNTGLHSLYYKRGRIIVPVKCENINSVLKRVNPTVIKMDIEGAEYECIKNIESFNGVREFIFEFHHSELKDIKTHEKYRELIRILQSHFDIVDYNPDTKGAWVSLVYCKNNGDI